MVAIDIGSNSLRAVKMDCKSKEIVGRYEKIVRTADGLEKRGEIGQEALERIVAAINEAKELFGKDEYKAIATAAFRKAQNKIQALRYIEEKTGLEIHVASPEEESFYSLKGVEYRLKKLGLDTQKFLMVDIGGASTEFVLKYRQDVVYKSFNMGILTFVQKYKTKEELLFGIKKELKKIKEYLLDWYEVFGKPKIFVGTGGTPTTVAALKVGLSYETYDPEKISGVSIDEEDIENAYKRLLSLPSKERAKLVGVGREDAIMAGLLILKELLKIAGYPSMIAVDDGVREGLALIECERLDKSQK